MQKPLYILTALMLLCLMAGCKDEPTAAEEAVLFGMQVSESEAAVPTRGDIVSSDYVKAQGHGIGVFAFLQKVKSNGYSTYFGSQSGEPNFMYNQRVTYDATYGWGYTPLQYWPNEEGDLCSFFAYAPYSESTAWTEDIAITANADGTRLSRKFIIEPIATDQKDYLWATPILNMEKPAVVSEKVNFAFSRVCARLGFCIGVLNPQPHGEQHEAGYWDNEISEVRIKSITLSNAYTEVDWLAIGSGSEWTETWTGKGKGSLTLSNDEALCEMEQYSDTISEKYWGKENEEGNQWKDPDDQTGPCFKRLNKKNAYMFLAPQDGNVQNIKFTLAYDVVVTGGTEQQTTQCTYEHYLTDLPEPINGKFERGKYYTITYHLNIDESLLGAMRIKATCAVDDWQDVSGSIDSGLE